VNLIALVAPFAALLDALSTVLGAAVAGQTITRLIAPQVSAVALGSDPQTPIWVVGFVMTIAALLGV